MKAKERSKAYNETFRRLAVEALGSKCSKCGETQKLHIHHKDRNVSNNSKENLALLCERCHTQEHGIMFGSHREGDGEYVRTTFYAFSETVRIFKEICYREGESMSKKVENFMVAYNQAHKPGNPQLCISNYAKPEEQQPMRVMCLFIKGAMSDGRVFCRQRGMWTPGVSCYSCDRNELRKRP